MIRINNLTVRYRNTVALANVNVTFPQGKVTALVGGDGAGKSTLLRELATRSGRKRLHIKGFSEAEVAYLPDGPGAWPNLSVEENLEFVAQTYGLRDYANAVDDLIETADLAQARHRIASHLSGGMRKKLATTMALLPRPQLLVLDEATTGVDPQSRERITTMVWDAARQGTTVIVSTTYLDEAENADHVVFLNNGKVVAAGTPAEVIALTPGLIWTSPVDTATTVIPTLQAHDHLWQRGSDLYEWIPHADSPRILSQGSTPALDLELSSIAFLLRDETLPRKRSHASRRQAPSRVPAAAAPTAVRLGNTPTDDHAPLVTCENVSKSFGRTLAVNGVSLKVLPGQVVGLTGGNGAGKSTLIRLILGLDQPDSGNIELCGQQPGLQARTHVGYVPQSLGLYPTLSAAENIAFTQDVFSAAHLNRATPQAHVESPAFDNATAVKQLPLGERRQVAVACALSHPVSLLILDEPTSGMDSLERARLWKQIRAAAAQGIGVLVTTHYQHEALQCDVVIRMSHGALVRS